MHVRAELNDILKSYTWVRRVYQTADGYRAILFPEQEHRDELEQYRGVWVLLNLMERPKDLMRLRRCADESCRAWMYGGKKFCSDRCKQHAYDSKPENRESKREYMRRYYAEEQKRSLNPKCAVGFGRKKSHKHAL